MAGLLTRAGDNAWKYLTVHLPILLTLRTGTLLTVALRGKLATFAAMELLRNTSSAPLASDASGM